MADKCDTSRRKMWPVLFRTIIENVNVESVQSVRLQQILSMISDSLTFDNPGLFSSNLITDPDEQLREKAVNIWLLNQLIFSIAKSDNDRLFHCNIALQKEILSACILKQSWLFKDVIEEYIKLTNSLVNATELLSTIQPSTSTSANQVKFEITAFQVDSFPIEQIDSEAVYHKFKITTENKKNLLVECCIKILKHSIALDLDAYSIDLFKKSLDCILYTFDTATSFTIKLNCIDFFQKVIQQVYDFSNKELLAQFLLVLKGCVIIIENLHQWIETNIIEKEQVSIFCIKFLDFLKELFLIKFKTEFYEEKLQFCKIYLNILINLISKRNTYKFLEEFDDINNNIIKYLSLLDFNDREDFLLNDKIFEIIIEKCSVTLPKVLRIFVNSITNEIKKQFIKTNFQNVLNIEQLSQIWLKIYQRLESIFDSFQSQHFIDGTLLNDLKFFNETLKLSNRIDYEFHLWHQKDHLKSEKCRLCSTNWSENYQTERFIDGSNIKVITIKCFFKSVKSIDTIINILKKFRTQFEDNDRIQNIITEIAYNILQSNECSNLNSNSQIKLLDFLINNWQRSEKKQSFSEQYQIILRFVNVQSNLLSPDALKYFQSSTEKIILKTFLETSLPQQFQTLYSNLIKNIIINQTIQQQVFEEKILKPYLKDFTKLKSLGENLRFIVCLCSKTPNNVEVFKIYDDKLYFKFKLNCKSCTYLEKNPEKFDSLSSLEGYYISYEKIVTFLRLQQNFEQIFDFISMKDTSGDLISSIPAILNHFDLIRNEIILEKWLKLIAHENLEIRLVFSHHIQNIIQLILLQTTENEPTMVSNDRLLGKCIQQFAETIGRDLCKIDQSIQSSILNLILKFGTVENLPEKWIIQTFRLMFLFLIRFESCVAHEASLCAIDICSKHNLTPMNLLDWYKQDVLRLIVSLCVSIYLRNGIGLNKALSNTSKMFGYIGPRYFINEHYKLLVAMLLPWCLKYPKSKELLDELANLIQEDLSVILTRAFLTTYSYLFTTESNDINSKCLTFIIDNTGSSIFNLLQSDIKRTIPEILIHYHKAPTNVMDAFRFLLLQDQNPSSLTTSSTANDIPHGKIAEYISTRFLGVLTYFETCLINPAYEKCLKYEILLSLGEILRFIGTKYVTPFRFKIVAMLRTSLTIPDTKLKNICSSVWKIFIHTVDIKTLGSLLSTIVASLEPLLEINCEEINSIYRFLIINNGSLLSRYIPNLYFIEKLPNVSADIKKFVEGKKEKLWKSNNSNTNIFYEKLKFFLEQIKHENIVVRQYGLQYLTQLFKDNRTSLNNLIIGRDNMDPIIEDILTVLVMGCRHIDKSLQIASGQCLGELGAIEPSHLPPNYSPQRNFSLSIHTDAFAIMALEELCKAYQFQKDTKYVDSFSLAIQEILLARGVCPKTKKKLEVWEAIPERMRQLMEPLLTSCYTGLKMNTNIKIHPIFGSSKCQTYEEWAFLWASKMIEEVQDDDTQHLLNSFKPSIKRDANILSLFLPYIVLHSIQTCSEEFREKIYEELECVFECAVNKQHQLNNENVNKSRMRGLKMINFNASKASMSGKDYDDAEESSEYMEIKCAKLAFEQLDFLERWLREWKQTYVGHSPDQNYQKIRTFLKRFNKKQIAKANFNCGEYARALMYMEGYLEDNSSDKSCLQDNLSFLVEVYAKLQDPDSVEGAIGLKKIDLTLSEQILVNNMTDRYTESIMCFEKLQQQVNYENQLEPTHVRDIVQCYLHLDTPETALRMSESLFDKLGRKYEQELREIQAEPLWRLGNFEELNELFQTSNLGENSSCWGVHCGKALLAFHKCNFNNTNNENDFELVIDKIRYETLKLFRTGGSMTTELNIYHKSYPQILKLHIITEIEKIYKLVEKIMIDDKISEKNCINYLTEFFKDWKNRLSLLQPIPRITEPLLCLRRILLKETKELLLKYKKNHSICTALNKEINIEIGNLWLQSIELQRKAGWFQQAQLCIMNAKEYEPETLFLEKAKFLWKKGDQRNCFKVLEQKINDIEEISKKSNNGTMENLPKNTRLLYAEAKFLQASYNAESMNISVDCNLKYFKESLEHNNKSEKCLVYFGQYLDKIYNSMSEEQQNSVKGYETLMEIMLCYGRSMSCGSEFIYQSMPRLLSIWLDFTAQMKRDEQFRKFSNKMNEMVDKLAQTLPLFTFYIAFSQIISRICHPSPDVFQVLKTIIVRLIQKFPQQSLWMILPAFKSSYASRVKRCTEIFSDRRLNDSQMQKLINDFNSLAERLIELTNKEIPAQERKPTVSSLVPRLPKLLQDTKFSQIIMPFQQFMQPTLPSIDERCNPAHNFNAFPNKYVYINGIQEEVTILMSLQRPRKVTFIGSDGKEYAVMMKPKDDLRKDFRLMEFNAVVKQYLHQDPEARQRRLGIRTYAVLPLNEECGLIEWLHNLHAFRQILISIYKHRNLAMTGRELKAAACKPNDPIEKKRNLFLNVFLPRHPPVFSEWFKHRFTTPHNWYQARISYIRTTAVMSIVGYILGLGDRHGENILFDGITGDAVHVDFNCLFNKGETFDYPETVPFRLTHNMVHAMGPLGIEGTFRKCCEITMKVLQSQTPTLMSVLRPFVYDSVVTWNRSYKSDGNTERIDPQAIINVKAIEERLKGYVKIKGKTSNMPLSPEGQVNHIISEATDLDNLAAMYVGWGAYM